jgi:hypothetical protein
LILKPHGSSYTFDSPTSVVWPSRDPDGNYSILDRFVKEIQDIGIKHVIILAYSCRHDDHMKPYLEQLKKLRVNVWQIEKYAEHPTTSLPVRWGVVKKRNLIQSLRNGTSDFLDALVQVRIPRQRMCIASKDPLDVFRTRMLKSRPRTTGLRVGGS